MFVDIGRCFDCSQWVVKLVVGWMVQLVCVWCVVVFFECVIDCYDEQCVGDVCVVDYWWCIEYWLVIVDWVVYDQFVCDLVEQFGVECDDDWEMVEQFQYQCVVLYDDWYVDDEFEDYECDLV